MSDKRLIAALWCWGFFVSGISIGNGLLLSYQMQRNAALQQIIATSPFQQPVAGPVEIEK